MRRAVGRMLLVVALATVSIGFQIGAEVVEGAPPAHALETATLDVFVRVETVFTPGASVTITSVATGTSRSATSDADGLAHFEGLPEATDFRVDASAPGASSDQVIHRVRTTAGTRTYLYVYVRSAAPPLAWQTAVNLPASSPADLTGPIVSEPTTGRFFIQKGQELQAFGDDGGVTGRIRGFGIPVGIATGAGSVFVSAKTTGGVVVTRVDPASLAVTGEWNVTTERGGQILFAGGKLHILAGSSSVLPIRVLDLVTGLVTDSGSPEFVTSFIPVARDPDRFVIYRERAGSKVLDVSGPVPVVVASDPALLDGYVAADGPTDRLWTSHGVERVLSTLEPTGRVVAVPQGWPSYSPARGGIVAVGSSVRRLSDLDVSHEVYGYGAAMLTASGDRAFRVDASDNLMVTELTPHLTADVPWPAYTDASLRLTGVGLGPTTSVTIDGVAVPFEVRSGSWLTVPPSSLAPGPHEIQVTTPWGTTEPRSFTAYERPDLPTVSAVEPATVPTSGGEVTITGTDFTLATRVYLASTVLTSFTIVDDSTITFVAPVKKAGVVTVRVANTVGTGTVGSPLSYVAPVPSVTSLSPSAGTMLGGDIVTITGTGFDFATSLTIDGVATPFTPVSSTQIRVRTPAHALGPAPIAVTTDGGTSAVGSTSTFTYRPPAPSVAALSPASGSTLGGTAVTITGNFFTGATAVRFGGVAATSFTVVDQRTVVAVSPPRSTAGTVNVVVTTPSGTSGAPVTSRFAYTAPPVGSISGVVRDTAGPLANMVVMVSPAAAPGLVTAVVTAADGSFSVPSLPVGSYKVHVFDGRLIFGVPAERVAEWYQVGGPGTADFAASSAIVVAGGADTVLEPITLAATAPGSISGVVTDGTAPLPGVVVMVSPASRQEVSAYAVTGADGRFTVAGLAPGSYKVVAVHSPVLYGLPPAYASEYYDDIPDGPSAFAAAPSVTVTASAATTLRTIAMQRL